MSDARPPRHIGIVGVSATLDSTSILARAALRAATAA
jgi:hypothetical protein